MILTGSELTELQDDLAATLGPPRLMWHRQVFTPDGAGGQTTALEDAGPVPARIHPAGSDTKELFAEALRGRVARIIVVPADAHVHLSDRLIDQAATPERIFDVVGVDDEADLGGLRYVVVAEGPGQ